MAEGSIKESVSKIFIAELEQKEYEKRLQRQQQLFKKGCQAGGFLDGLRISYQTNKYKSLFGLVTLKTGKRATHAYGLGLSGYAVVEGDLDLPENDFFIPGRIFEMRGRHTNFPDAEDDTKLGVRSLALKFSDHDYESPLDFICHTGPQSPFFNSDSIGELTTALRGGTEAVKKYLLSLPIYLESHIGGVRRVPDSYYHQHYYAQTVFEFHAKDGLRRLARFRILPEDGSSESGILTEDQQKECWNMDSAEGETRPKDYLKLEMTDRMKKGPVGYQLQIQLHDIAAGTEPDHMLYNASLEWPDDPWKNVLKIIFASILPPEVTEVTRFNIGNLPGVLSLPAARSIHDFNIVPELRTKVYAGVSSVRPSKPDVQEDGAIDYEVTVVTGIQKGTGTDADVSISLIGDKDRTAFQKLDHLLWDDFERSSTGTYLVHEKDVGGLLCIKVFIEPRKPDDDWLLDSITIATSGKFNEKNKYHFPCYRWLNKSRKLVTLVPGKATLPQEAVHPYLQLMRTLEKDENRRLYQWRPRDLEPELQGLPGFIQANADGSKLPRDIQFYDEKQMEIDWKRKIGSANGVFGNIKAKIAEELKLISDPDPYVEKEKLMTKLIKKSPLLDHIIKYWKTDEEFGRQILQGMNPVQINRITELPENFPVSEDMLKDELKGRTLKEELEAGRMFMVSYPDLEEAAKSCKEKFLCAPMCLLHVQGNQLLPVAIQLTQTPSENSPIFTRQDDKGEYSDWSVAKMWVKVADTNVHQLATHLLGTHLLMEPIAIATLRNIPSMHPIFKLLMPHIHFVIAINTLGRELLIPDGTAISQILAIAETPGGHINFMSEQYKKFKFSQMDLHQDLESRGVLDQDLLPGYYYRNDGLLMWDAIKSYISDIISIYYKDDAALQADDELSSFLLDLRANGFHADIGLPEQFLSKDELVHFLTIVIFRCSCQHAAVNFGQLDQYGFAPNAPPSMSVPPPTSKKPEGYTAEEIRQMLPEHIISQRFIAVANLLSMLSDTEEYLGDYPQYFTDEEAQAAVRRFQARLKDISALLHRRNDTLQVAYTYLLPERTPNSIAI